MSDTRTAHDEPLYFTLTALTRSRWRRALAWLLRREAHPHVIRFDAYPDGGTHITFRMSPDGTWRVIDRSTSDETC